MTMTTRSESPEGSSTTPNSLWVLRVLPTHAAVNYLLDRDVRVGVQVGCDVLQKLMEVSRPEMRLLEKIRAGRDLHAVKAELEQSASREGFRDYRLHIHALWVLASRALGDSKYYWDEDDAPYPGTHVLESSYKIHA